MAASAAVSLSQYPKIVAKVARFTLSKSDAALTSLLTRVDACRRFGVRNLRMHVL